MVLCDLWVLSRDLCKKHVTINFTVFETNQFAFSMLEKINFQLSIPTYLGERLKFFLKKTLVNWINFLLLPRISLFNPVFLMEK